MPLDHCRIKEEKMKRLFKFIIQGAQSARTSKSLSRLAAIAPPAIEALF